MKIIWLGLPFLLLGGCHKKDPSPEETLPPATQTGANTFGCLVNGQPWTPRGFDGTDNFRLVYDPGYHGGTLEIRAYRYLPNQAIAQYIYISGAPMNRPGTYPLDAVSAGAYYASGAKGPCYDYDYLAPGFRIRGQVVLTRLDLGAGIVSGTFAYTLYKPGCDTLKITQGRFDKKL